MDVDVQESSGRGLKRPLETEEMSSRKRARIELNEEVNPQNPESLIKAFSPFPLFESALTASLNRKGLQKTILQLGLPPKIEDYFKQAIESNSKYSQIRRSRSSKDPQ